MGNEKQRERAIQFKEYWALTLALKMVKARHEAVQAKYDEDAESRQCKCRCSKLIEQ